MKPQKSSRKVKLNGFVTSHTWCREKSAECKSRNGSRKAIFQSSKSFLQSSLGWNIQIYFVYVEISLRQELNHEALLKPKLTFQFTFYESVRWQSVSKDSAIYCRLTPKHSRLFTCLHIWWQNKVTSSLLSCPFALQRDFNLEIWNWKSFSWCCKSKQGTSVTWNIASWKRLERDSSRVTLWIINPCFGLTLRQKSALWGFCCVSTSSVWANLSPWRRNSTWGRPPTVAAQ